MGRARTTERSIVWRKAAVLGSLWAASEIVLGSFLHNARVPLTGEGLTAIGIAILVAGQRGGRFLHGLKGLPAYAGFRGYRQRAA